MASPQHALRDDTLDAVRSLIGPWNGLSVTFRTQEVGTIPYQYYWAKVDPKRLITRGSKLWEEAQRLTFVPIMHVQLPTTTGPLMLHSIMKAVEEVIDKYIKIFREGSELYSVGQGVDPSQMMVMFKPFNVSLGPRNTVAILPPPPSELLQVEPSWKFRRNLPPKQIIQLENMNDPKREEWEREWVEWNAARAA
ncbi:uncharacterized protein GGS25DRAFT_523944 [Hypoxylon fragiforme]|uniref:uncharacterized protein n=1 Tax=Hypoxylon fragiforme TaxID=63214 RepID=UPI0020C6388B|nr:uncharacterized protein GGS25DRAFT_523944 [Hypoxylon fragiforme]KAI2606278.1 hypothetical protein GGS25DRAFT_523944 [Hypoxylon fragiforme]